jgi:outer membrane biosynthesis protein TonB
VANQQPKREDQHQSAERRGLSPVFQPDAEEWDRLRRLSSRSNPWRAEQEQHRRMLALLLFMLLVAIALLVAVSLQTGGLRANLTSYWDQVLAFLSNRRPTATAVVSNPYPAPPVVIRTPAKPHPEKGRQTSERQGRNARSFDVEVLDSAAVKPANPDDQVVRIDVARGTVIAPPKVITTSPPTDTGLAPQSVTIPLAQTGAGPRNPATPAAKITRPQAVVLRAHLGKDGSVQQLGVVSGPPALREAAIEAAKNWYYSPRYRDGQPVESEIEIVVNFSNPQK